MKNSIQKISMVGLALFITFAFCPVNFGAFQREVKVAVLPFDISSAGPFSYVGPATEEVLRSRLASDSISVMDYLEIQRITGKRQEFISFPDTRDIADKLGVEYVVTGKVITEGGNITIDMDLLQADSESPLFFLAFSPESLDEIPLRIEEFATQAANCILIGPKSVTAETNTGNEQRAPQELSQEETAQDKDIIIARMHPDLMIRQSSKDSSKPEGISMPQDKGSYTQKLPVMPPEPLSVTAEDNDDILLPDYPPPPDEPIPRQATEDQTISTSLPGSEQLILPRPPVKEEKRGWFSWIRNPWGGKDTSDQSEAPASTPPYQPQEASEKQQAAATIPQASNTEQPIPPTDGPIWQWY